MTIPSWSTTNIVLRHCLWLWLLLCSSNVIVIIYYRHSIIEVLFEYMSLYKDWASRFITCFLLFIYEIVCLFALVITPLCPRWVTELSSNRLSPQVAGHLFGRLAKRLVNRLWPNEAGRRELLTKQLTGFGRLGILSGQGGPHEKYHRSTKTRVLGK